MVNKKVIQALIQDKWKEWQVKFEKKPLRWDKEYLRTVKCHFCGKEAKERYPNEGFFGWSILSLAIDREGKSPEVCPDCLKKVGEKLTVKEPRVERCSKCGTVQKEKIFGIGFPGWIYIQSLQTLGSKKTPIVCPDCYLKLGLKLGPKFIRGTWTSLTYPADSLLTSTKMTQNQANFTAVAEGHTDAPVISGDIQTAKGKLIKKIAVDDNTYTIIDDDAKVWRAVFNDLAELMPVRGETKPGDVLIWVDGKVEKSKFANDKRVIGVHSDTYGFLLGGSNQKSIKEAIKKGFVPVAISGKVKVKVVGPVTVGDMLMTSNIEGVAMRGNVLGGIVGKALEDLLPAEQKKIEMLITVR